MPRLWPERDLRQPCGMRDVDLLRYTEQDLSGARGEYVELHVRFCPYCQQWLHDFEEIGRLLRSRPVPVTEPWRKEQLLRRLEEEASRPTSRWMHLLPRALGVMPGRWVAIPLAVITVLILLVAWRPVGTFADFPLFRVIRFAELTSPANPPTNPDGGTITAQDQFTMDDSDLADLPADAIAPERLPFGLRLTDWKPGKNGTISLLYENGGDLTIEFLQVPPGQGRTTLSPDVEHELTHVGTTTVMVLPDPRPDAVSAMIWERSGAGFNLLVLDTPPGNDGGLRLADARQIVEAIMAAQDAAMLAPSDAHS